MTGMSLEVMEGVIMMNKTMKDVMGIWEVEEGGGGEVGGEKEEDIVCSSPVKKI